jgi:hypothetical protein
MERECDNKQTAKKGTIITKRKGNVRKKKQKKEEIEANYGGRMGETN